MRKGLDGTDSITDKFNKNACPLDIKPLQAIEGYEGTEAARQVEDAVRKRAENGQAALGSKSNVKLSNGPGVAS